MAFTDKDLKRFKDCVCEMGVEKVTFFDFDLQALLTRLEAAEKVCAEWEANANLEHKCSLNDLHKAWRKSKGEL